MEIARDLQRVARKHRAVQKTKARAKGPAQERDLDAILASIADHLGDISDTLDALLEAIEVDDDEVELDLDDED
jgi:hypothetical protein